MRPYWPAQHFDACFPPDRPTEETQPACGVLSPQAGNFWGLDDEETVMLIAAQESRQPVHPAVLRAHRHRERRTDAVYSRSSLCSQSTMDLVVRHFS